MAYTVTDIGPTTGVEISGLSGAELVDQGVADVASDALNRRGVVVFREANLSDGDLVAFSRLLGKVAQLPLGGDSEHPEIQKVTRDATKSKLAAYREGTFFWHIDGTTAEIPDKATVLMARQVSDDDTGDTEFANTYAAYEELPDDLKAELEGTRVVHSFAASQLLVYPDPDPKERAAWDRNPSREHPLVWTRGSGKKSMVLGSTAERVVGRSEDESKDLLTRLLDWSTQDRFTLRHKWRVGDVVIWDNTGMLHRACPYGEQSARLMLRTSLVGEEVVQ
ncbi:alpha-ketoglutarate-dependent taurine dioxygenase [Rhodococcus sp. SMB37]|uniref:TauD/TfdA dioxygenase family protein n=1 Tax=Rhodococcus sp. SMB37 TaxID=2512213 RepID=UPI00104BC9B2|nr:TauD/TfdA family dioxygenase [Rhodococcus sp. SMB37]TCN55964.1 alpha-ketoglutarate-dependent taurine dioxygenase [Rhodococcus sp. SMB37]